MLTDTAKFTVGQTVVVTRHGRYASSPRYRSTGTIEKIWKNGVVVVKLAYGKAEFDPRGHERGESGHRSIRPLADGETPESIDAEQDAADAARKSEDDAKAAARAKAIAEWWDTAGKAIWDARVQLPPFLDEQVVVIRYTYRGEERMPFVVLREEKDNWSPDGKTRLVATVGGLVGRRYDATDSSRKSINTYSSSEVRGATLAEVLYDVCH